MTSRSTEQRQRAARRALLAKRRGILPADGQPAPPTTVTLNRHAQEEQEATTPLRTVFKGRCRKCRERGHKSNACPFRDSTGMDIVGKKPRVVRPKRTQRQRKLNKKRRAKKVYAAPKKAGPEKKKSELIGEECPKKSVAQKRKARKARSELVNALESMSLCF